MAQAKKTSMKKKVIHPVPKGRVYVQATFNNTIISITDQKGNVISWASAGGNNFKGARKSTPYAAQVTLKAAADKAKAYGVESVDVLVSGVGQGREAAVRAIQGTGMMVSSIKDVTPIPHNGTRAKKPRRV
jgi:small subunit ribosomal protein S11